MGGGLSHSSRHVQRENTKALADDGEGAMTLTTVSRTAVPGLLDSITMEALAKFNELDKDHNGRVDKDEIAKFAVWLLQTTHYDVNSPPHEEVEMLERRILEIYDGDGDASLGFAEFKELYDDSMVRVKLVLACEKKFQELDGNQDGYIDWNEAIGLVQWLLDCYQELGCTDQVRHQIQQAILQKYDFNEDRKLVRSSITDLLVITLAVESVRVLCFVRQRLSLA